VKEEDIYMKTVTNMVIVLEVELVLLQYTTRPTN